MALKIMDYVDHKDIKKEANFLMKLNHPNVVQVKGICLSESCDYGLETIWNEYTSSFC